MLSQTGNVLHGQSERLSFKIGNDMSKKMIIYELYKTVNGGEPQPITQSLNQGQIEASAAVMNKQAARGVLYGVRQVEAVTRPFRVVES